MDFKSWFQKKMKQQLSSSSKEEEITKIRSKIDSVENESKEVDIQPIEQQPGSRKKIFTTATFSMFYVICQNSG